MITLLNMKLNQQAVIISVNHPDEGMERRLFDLGFYPGTTVEKILVSPHQDPVAYRVRGTTVALRNSDAQYIQIKEEGK